MQVWSLSGDNPLEKEMATYSSIFAWDIQGTEEPGGLQSMQSQKSRHDWAWTPACITQKSPSLEKRREWRSVPACGGWRVERERERPYPCRRERERGERQNAWLLLLYVFFPLGLPYANWAQPGALFYLKSSLRSSDLPFTFLCSIFRDFPFLVL